MNWHEYVCNRTFAEKMKINDKLALGEWNRGRWKKKKKFAKAKQSSPKLSLPLSLLNERYYQYAVNFTNKFELWKTFWLFFFFQTGVTVGAIWQYNFIRERHVFNKQKHNIWRRMKR